MKGLLVTSVLAVLFLGLVAFSANKPVGGTDSVLFVVQQGSGAQTIAASLKEAELIRSERFFLFTTWSRGTRGDFKAGSFELSPSMSTREIERALTTGKAITDEVAVTVLEGWTIRDIARHLEAEGIASAKEFYNEVGQSAEFAGGLPDWEASYPILSDKPQRNSLEGYLFPDTYRIFPSAGAKGLVRRMLDNFDAKLTPELRQDIAASGHSVFDIITMASVIEREVFGEADRAVVSGIFWNRVNAGMGLQADSTVNYITGGKKPAVSFAETKIDSPWNTYKYRGLPVGPIGNPGLSAIKAAIYPAETSYFYFLTDAAGNVHYGRTLDEHNANKAKYLR